MTIYWERCDFCGQHNATRECTMFPELYVCPHCCLSCMKRGVCPNPAWKFSFELKPTPRPARRATGKEALLDLLSKLEEKK